MNSILFLSVNPFETRVALRDKSRLVNQALRQELQQIHALALHTLTPQEWQTRAGQVADSPKCRGGGKNQ